MHFKFESLIFGWRCPILAHFKVYSVARDTVRVKISRGIDKPGHVMMLRVLKGWASNSHSR